MNGRELIVNMVRACWYYIKEAFRSIFRNGWMSLASIGVVAVTLLILGSFMLLNINVEHLTYEIKNQLEIVAYVEKDLPPEKVDQLRVSLIKLPKVEEVRFISRQEAMDRLREQLGEMVSGYEEEDRNPLRDSFEIRTMVPEDIPEVAGMLQRVAGIAQVDYGRDVVEKLFRFTAAIKWIGLSFMVGLTLTALFLIINTIKLTVNARSKEIMIMKYVGATEWFIRWPFLIEGLLLGSFGAFIPTFLLVYLYWQAVSWAQVNIYFPILVPPDMVLGQLARVLLTLGTTLGGLGSIISMRRFLRV